MAVRIARLGSAIAVLVLAVALATATPSAATPTPGTTAPAAPASAASTPTTTTPAAPGSAAPNPSTTASASAAPTPSTTPSGPAPVASTPAAPSPSGGSSAAAPAPTPAVAAGPNTVVCTGALDLGATGTCSVPTGGGIGRYALTVPAAQALLLHGINSDERRQDATVTLFGPDGTMLCTQQGATASDCDAPSAGTYQLEISDTHTAVASVTATGVQSASCSAPLDQAVGADPVPVQVAAPGAAWCADLANAPAHAVLDVAVEQLTNGPSEAFSYAVYDADGARICGGVVRPYYPAECVVGGHRATRVFVSPNVAATDQPAVALAVTRLSQPTGCAAGSFTPFGAAPTANQGTLDRDHPLACFVVPAAAGARLALSVVSTSTYGFRLEVRGMAGTVACVDVSIPNCVVAVDGSYTVFVSILQLPRSLVHFSLGIVDLSSSPGCVARTSTAWNSHPFGGTLAKGEVDCFTIPAAAGHVLEITESPANAVLLDPDGRGVACGVLRTCTVTQSGSYRFVVWPRYGQAPSFKAWAVDLSSTAGCKHTTPDPFGQAPTRTAELDGDVLHACFVFSAPAGARYDTEDFHLSGAYTWDVGFRALDGTAFCGGCAGNPAGERLLVVSTFQYPPAPASLAIGLYRIDGSSPSCPAMATTVDADPVTDTMGSAQEDCRHFAGPAGTGVAFALAVPAGGRAPQVRILDSAGTSVCYGSFYYGADFCTLTGTAPFRVLLDDSTSSYTLRIVSLTAKGGCRSLPPTSFGHAPSRAFTLRDTLPLGCFLIAPGGATDLVAARTVGSSTASIGAYSQTGYSCTPRPGVTLLECSGVHGTSSALVIQAPQSTSGTVGWYDVTAGTGCVRGPTLAFGAPARAVALQQPGAVACQILSVATEDFVRVAWGTAPGGAHLVAQLDDYCVLTSTSARPEDCRPNYHYDNHLLTYEDNSAPTFSGSVSLHAWRLNQPKGCVDAGSLHDPLGPLVGTLADAGDEACYRAASVGGTVQLTATDDQVPGDVPAVDLYPVARLYPLCSIAGTGNCAVKPGGTLLLVRRVPPAPGTGGAYRVEGSCVQGPCGP